MGGLQGGEPRGVGGTLRLALEVDPHSLDPAQVYSNEEATVALLIFETLLKPGPDGGLLPCLARALPTTSADGLVHTFEIRRGVRFSDGRELQASDILLSFERFFDPEVAAINSGYFRAIEGGVAFAEARRREGADPVERARHKGSRWLQPLTVSGLRAPDTHTVEIHLRNPDLSFLKALALPPAAIVSGGAVKEGAHALSSKLLGTGRFMIKDRVRGARLRLSRNPFHESMAGPDAVDILVNMDRSTQAMMFERGELDFQYYVHDADFIRWRRDPKMQPLVRPLIGTSPTFIFLNCELPPFTNRLVRLALNHAVDRDALVRTLANRGVPGHGPLPLTVRGFNRDLPVYPYDPAKARALLSEAGFPNGFETTLWVNRDSPNWVKIALFVQESLRRIEVRATIKEVGYPTLLDSCGRRRTVPMGTWDWVSAFDDPKDTLDGLLNGDNIIEEGCVNNSFYSNSQVQQLFRDAESQADPGRRMDIYRRIERQVVEDAPWIFLVQLNLEMMCQPWLKGLVQQGFWPPAHLENCWIER